MPSVTRAGAARPAVSWARLLFGAVLLAVLGYTYVLGVPSDGPNPFNFFGYFTNLTNLITGLTFIVTGALGRRGAVLPPTLHLLRGAAVAYMLVVGVIYNTLIPGTGTAPPWVSLLLHAIAPAVVLLDWLFVGDRHRLPWRSLWVIFPYPVIWLAVVLVRGVTDGWVPYGFLLPSHGAAYVLAHIAGLLLALTLAGALVWLCARTPGAAALIRR
ncbi:Pr6Pr family membrane protein [Leucobacter sp. NPDC015123]|uniref:Pr6Pr family membrane protein n=1 Tax=Leucobacter sp. NPDC015123 TaxID=3364129 RepID=UPI0036F46BD5